MHGRQLGKEGGIGGVGPVVDQQVGGAGHDSTIAVEPGGDVDDHAFPPPVRGEKLLLSGKHQLHGPSGGSGEGGNVGLVVEAALTTETTTEVGHDNAYPVGGKLQGLAHTGPGVEGNLSGAPDCDLFTLPLGHHRPGFDRCGVAGVGHVTTADDRCRIVHCGNGITLHDR